MRRRLNDSSGYEIMTLNKNNLAVFAMLSHILIVAVDEVI